MEFVLVLALVALYFVVGYFAMRVVVKMLPPHYKEIPRAEYIVFLWIWPVTLAVTLMDRYL